MPIDRCAEGAWQTVQFRKRADGHRNGEVVWGRYAVCNSGLGQDYWEQLVKLLQLKRESTPSHPTIRRIMGWVVYQEEIERWVGTYNQCGEHGGVYALDGKAPRGSAQER